MKPILIAEKNRIAIEAALHAANGTATGHTYTTYDEISRVVSSEEKLLLSFVGAAKYTIGAVITATSGGNVANKYGYKRAATQVTCERKTQGWYLMRVEKTEIYPDGPGRPIIAVPAETLDAGVKYALKRANICPVA